MRHDRYGELLEAGEGQAAPHGCRDGWIDRDAERPRPCLRCRPYLAHRPPKPRPHPDVARAGSAAVRAALAARRPHRPIARRRQISGESAPVTVHNGLEGNKEMARQPEETENWHDQDYTPHSGEASNSTARTPFDEIAPKIGDAQAHASWGAAGSPAPGPSTS